MNILHDHGAERWAGYDNHDGTAGGSIYINLLFADGKSFQVSGSVMPEGFEELKKEFVFELKKYYDEVKDRIVS